MFLSRRSKDKHVKVKEEPPKWGRVINVGAVGGGGKNGLDDCGLEVAECRFVARSEEVTPSGAEIGWFVGIHR